MFRLQEFGKINHHMSLNNKSVTNIASIFFFFERGDLNNRRSTWLRSWAKATDTQVGMSLATETYESSLLPNWHSSWATLFALLRHLEILTFWKFLRISFASSMVWHNNYRFLHLSSRWCTVARQSDSNQRHPFPKDNVCFRSIHAARHSASSANLYSWSLDHPGNKTSPIWFLVMKSSPA